MAEEKGEKGAENATKGQLHKCAADFDDAVMMQEEKVENTGASPSAHVDISRAISADADSDKRIPREEKTETAAQMEEDAVTLREAAQSEGAMAVYTEEAFSPTKDAKVSLQIEDPVSLQSEEAQGEMLDGS
eukprot:781232-Rhodomonas_salina.1